MGTPDPHLLSWKEKGQFPPMRGHAASPATCHCPAFSIGDADVGVRYGKGRQAVCGGGVGR